MIQGSARERLSTLKYVFPVKGGGGGGGGAKRPQVSICESWSYRLQEKSQSTGVLAKDFLSAYDSMKAAYTLANSVQLSEGDFITFGASTNDSRADDDEEGSWWIW